MADEFGVFITGAREVELAFDEEIPLEFHQILYEQVAFFTKELEAVEQARIPRRTGELASEMDEWVDDAINRITGYVSFTGDYAKAGALEYGAPGPRNRNSVKAHPERLSHVFARHLAAPLTVMVAAHTRRLNIREYRFARGALETLTPQIEAGLQTAIDERLGR